MDLRGARCPKCGRPNPIDRGVNLACWWCEEVFPISLLFTVEVTDRSPPLSLITFWWDGPHGFHYEARGWLEDRTRVLVQTPGHETPKWVLDGVSDLVRSKGFWALAFSRISP